MTYLAVSSIVFSLIGTLGLLGLLHRHGNRRGLGLILLTTVGLGIGWLLLIILLAVLIEGT